MATNPVALAKKALAILEDDAERLKKIDQYHLGQHVKPYTPPGASQEFKDLAERAITNWMPNLVQTSGQALFADNYRRDGIDDMIETAESKEWEHWQRSRLDANQSPIHYAALKFGHSFAVTERDRKGKVITKGLSTLRTVTLYEDIATDLDPVAAVYFKRFATGTDAKERGHVIVWDETKRFELWYDSKQNWGLRPKGISNHGNTQCPVTRFTAFRDLEGRTWGVIEPMIPIQDRINQTIFDLLVAQTYTSFTVRYVTGMAPPMKMRTNEDGELEPVLDEDGNPIPDKQYINAARWFYGEDKDVKFGDLPAGDLTGFIAAAELAVRHLSALSQTPPHFLLGEIANISAEALEAAETALARRIEEFRTSFGESWERVMRLAAELEGDAEAIDDYSGEIIWRDLGASSLAQSADALGKFAEALGIPKRGLWSRVPKASKTELAYWERLRQEDDREMQLYEAAVGRTGSAATTAPVTSTQTATQSGVRQPSGTSAYAASAR